MTIVNPALMWRKTNAPVSSSRTDDIWFASAQSGWAVNSNGQILKTDDGGNSWIPQHQDSSVYLRCVGFFGDRTGWVGSVGGPRRLFHTVDGGATWTSVDNLPPAPAKICGISVVDEQVVYASGTNDPADDPAVLKSVDGGATWTSIDMRRHASLLVDIRFETRERGWVVGGLDAVACPGQRATRDVVRPVVLLTEDGGASWTNLIAGIDEREFPLGEWGWKLFFLNNRIAFVSLENFRDGAILKSVDGGGTWKRLRINDRQRNSNLEGVGFISETVGWVGGWGSFNFRGGFTSQTTDGGVNWDNANEVGFRLNRFRFFGDPVTVGYASGDTVYKYTTEPLVAGAAPPLAALAFAQPVEPLVVSLGSSELVVDVPRDSSALRVELWDRFGNRLEIATEDTPQAGERTIGWTPEEAAAANLLGNAGILRVTVDDRVESRLVPLT